jgi:hypothetical protein
VEPPIVIAARFNGPVGSGNGGYTCGLVAERLGGTDVEVTLRRPPPLERELAVSADGGAVEVRAGEDVVAEGRARSPRVALAAPVSADEAAAGSARYTGFHEHHFPTCFVCGPLREPGDGLRIFAGPVPGRDDGVVAALWRPDEVRRELVWAALDCPGAFAVGWAERGETVLGRMTARVESLPAVGEECVVMAWPRGEDGRKLFAGTAVLGADSRVLGYAEQTWIVPR